MPETPAFKDNIDIMMQQIADAGGTAPTLRTGADTDGNPLPPDYRQQVGTVQDAGKQMFTFRLAQRYEDAELITWLQSGMSGPQPPIKVLGSWSAARIIEGGTPEEPTLDYEVIHTMVRSAVMRYFRIQDYDEDGEPVGNPHPPTPSDNFGVSLYAGGLSIVV